MVYHARDVFTNADLLGENARSGVGSGFCRTADLANVGRESFPPPLRPPIRRADIAVDAAHFGLGGGTAGVDEGLGAVSGHPVAEVAGLVEDAGEVGRSRRQP